ncbi:hypothetical protein C2E23DRAFT_723663 [Lenzites betulinus]|nr:hypothetical protein C2E23DRAFT_723663 [Lenzites betulinus]
MRPLISYDDIVAPDTASAQQQMNPPAAPPPTKKRKTYQNQNQHRQGQMGGGRAHQNMYHWDDPANQEPQMMYDEMPTPSTSASTGAGGGHVGGAAQHYDEEEEEEEESRELTHEEIWDDSALIDAWNSAAAEYEAFHGPGKTWKDQPAKKSPLWYNVPPATTSKQNANKSASNGVNAASANAHAASTADTNSIPLNFDTYVPTHDPSLVGAGSALAAPAMDGAALAVGSEAAMVSQDEAFTRAMTAMYWSGYWTAVYHSRRNEAQQNGAGAPANGADDGDDAVEDDADDDDMLPAQR